MIWGEYWDIGKFGFFLLFEIGDLRFVMFDMLYWLLLLLGYGWVDGCERLVEDGERNLFVNCRFKVGLDCWLIDGGVEDLEVGVVLLLVLLDVLVDCLVWKFCLDCFCSFLKLKRDGVMVGVRDVKMGSF